MTAAGGHVGWPVGLRPWIYKWNFQNTLILEFCSSIKFTGRGEVNSEERK